MAKNSSPEAKPTSDSHSWRIVYWAQLLGYWARKLFNTQRYEIVHAETVNKPLASAIKAIKETFSKKDANYFDLHQTSAFNENLGIVVGKFVENRNIAHINNGLEDSGSEIGVPLPFFQPQNITKNLDIPLSTSSVSPPPPAFPPPPLDNDAWEADDCVDSPSMKFLYFAELDSKDQIKAVIANLKNDIPQDFKFDTNSFIEIVEKVKLAFTEAGIERAQAIRTSIFSNSP